jgi:hypothetical protein
MKRTYLLSIPLVLACQQTSDTSLATSRSFLPMAALDNRVAYVDNTSGSAFLLDPADPALRPRILPTGKSPIVAEKRSGANQLLVLTHGVEGEVNVEAEPARLFVIDPASSDAPTSYDLPGRYDQLAQSDDGAFAVLYYSSSSSAANGYMLYNPNDLAVVTFASGTIRSRPIRSLGSAPSSVSFSPPGSMLFGSPRNLAVILAANYVTLLDLDNADHKEITLPLAPNGQQTVTPLQVLFDMAGAAIYVRADGSNDIFQVSLAPGAPADEATSTTKNDFHVSLSLLGAGSKPMDMAMFDAADGSVRLAVAAPDARQLVILDPKTGNATSVSTGVPVNQILKFNGRSPKSPDLEDRAMLWGSGATTLVFADLQDVETTKALAIESWSTSAPVSQVTSLPGNIALLSPKGGTSYGSVSLSVVNLADRTIEPIGSGGTLADVTVETAAPSRLWGTDGGNRLEYLDLVDHGQGRLFPGEVILDQPITSISPLAAPSVVDRKRYLVLEMEYPTKVGYVTVLDADQPNRKGARSVYGFLLTDYLERGQP